ncbi:MAG: hypothetical protein JNM79_14010 [Burkholderiales bacterium]|nr:hypothetical protein [Burkholderiales bacterium]
MHDEIFSDRIGEITLTGPLARLDLVSLSATEKDAEGKPKPVLRQRVVMPIDGFVQSFGLMAQVMQQLEKQGLVTRNAAPGEVRPTSPAAAAQSPNFK